MLDVGKLATLRAVLAEGSFSAAAQAGTWVVPLSEEPPRVLLPAGARLADAATLSARRLARETWIRAHAGSAARLIDHVLAHARRSRAIRLAGHGDEPIEAQA